MADTTYTSGVTVISSDTMNDLNRLHYTIFADPADIAAVRATIYAAATGSGTSNIAIGSAAADSLTSGDFNLAIGKSSLTALTTGGYNVAMGYIAADKMSSAASRNVAIGYRAGSAVGPNTFSGSDNVCIGSNAGVYVSGASSSVSQCVFVGSSAGDASATNVNTICIGYFATPSSTFASNEITLGNSSMETLRTAAAPTFLNGTAPAPAASTAVGLRMSSTADFGVFFGSGSPSGTVTAAKGSLYLRTDSTTTNNRMYVNTDGATTWTAVITAA